MSVIITYNGITLSNAESDSIMPDWRARMNWCSDSVVSPAYQGEGTPALRFTVTSSSSQAKTTPAAQRRLTRRARRLFGYAGVGQTPRRDAFEQRRVKSKGSSH